MTELDLMVDLHKYTARQGPGSEQDTLKALSFLKLSGHQPLTIADLGCGTGGPTLTLAQQLDAHITAVDLFPDFLEVLHQRSIALGLADKIAILERSMENLPFKPDTFDIIWSEGAIYNLGFENGIRQWKNYLKMGGYLAVSEITWITNTRPNEVEAFWTTQYPEIDSTSNKIRKLETNGFSLAGYFYLPSESWMDNYYTPLQRQFDPFMKRHQHSELAQKIVQEHQIEIDLYLKYQNYYSYGFYIARKTE